MLSVTKKNCTGIKWKLTHVVGEVKFTWFIGMNPLPAAGMMDKKYSAITLDTRLIDDLYSRITVTLVANTRGGWVDT